MTPGELVPSTPLATDSAAMTTASEPESPTGLFRRPVSRRSVLGAMGVASLAVGTYQLLGWGAGHAIASPRPQRPPVRDADGNLIQPGPYTMQASCDLSEDYFATAEVVINASAGDRVMPFVNYDNGGAVEAIVFTAPDPGSGAAGSVHHLQRNLNYQSGWYYADIPLPANVAQAHDATVLVYQGTAWLMVMGSPTEPGGVQLWLTNLSNATDWWTGIPATADVEFSSSQTGTWGPIKSGIDPTGVLYFYQSFTSTRASSLICYVADGNWGVRSVTTRIVFEADDASAPLQDYVLQYDTDPSLTSTNGWLVALLGPYLAIVGQGPPKAGFGSLQFTDDVLWNSPPAPVTDLVWAWSDPRLGPRNPAIAYQASTNVSSTYFHDVDGDPIISEGVALAPGHSAAVWYVNDLYTLNTLDPDGNLRTMAQYQGDDGSVWGGQVTIAKGIASVFGVPTDQNQATLFAVDEADVLNVLVKDPATGWSQHIVYQPSGTTSQSGTTPPIVATTQEVVSWRCQLTVWDTNQVGVAGGSVQLSTTKPVGLWLAGTSAVLLPGSPVTLTCDGTGKLTASIPCTGLDTAQLTAQALDTDGNPSGDALVITPDGDVHSYLGGSGSLASTGGGKIADDNGTALADAKSKTWGGGSVGYTATTTMPNLANAPSGTAANIAAACHHTMSLPNPASASGTRSALLDFTGSNPSFTTSTDPNAYNSHLTGEDHWWNTVRQDIDSVFQALRNGLIDMTKMVTTLADDATSWTINLVVRIGDGLDHLMSWVVTGIEDAIHAVSSFFHTLGADLKAAWDWLKNLVLGVIVEAEANAKVLEGWCGQISGAAQTQLTQLQVSGDTFFQNLEPVVLDMIGTLTGAVSNTQVNQAAPQPQPTTGSSGDDSGSVLKDVDDFFKVMQHSPANWLLKKIESALPAMASDNIKVDMSVFDTPLTDFLKAVNAAEAVAVDAGNTLYDAVKALAGSSNSLGNAQMPAVISAFAQTLDDILQLLDALFDTAIALMQALVQVLEDLLTTEFNPLGLIGDLLEFAGIDVSVSVEHLTCLIVSYPATIGDRLAGGNGTLFPGVGGSAARPGELETSDPLGNGLGIAAAFAQMVWAIDDVAMDLDTMDGRDSPDLVWILDFSIPLLMFALQWPSPPTANQTAAPFTQSDFSNSTTWGQRNNFLPGIVVTTAVPWVFEAIGWLMGKKWTDSGAVNAINDWGVPLVQTAGGAVNTILGAMYQWANATDTGSKARAIVDNVLPNLSYCDMFLELPGLVKLEYTMIVKMVIDCIANFGAAGLYWVEANI